MHRQFAFLDHPGPIPFAHRGGAGDWPENTLPAFEGAIRLGYRYLETDVHATADGVVVAFHDDRLDRVTDRAGRIADLPWREVRRARVAGKEPICLLEDLLATFPEARFNIDAKSHRAVGPLAAVVQRTGSLDRVCLAAFSDRRVGRLRRLLGPELCTVVGPAGVARLRAASFGARTGRIAGACVQVPCKVGRMELLDRRFVRAAHAAGLEVHPWTIDDPDEMHRLLDLGVDGIMTDRPAVLREVLESRGEWA